MTTSHQAALADRTLDLACEQYQDEETEPGNGEFMDAAEATSHALISIAASLRQIADALEARP